MTEPVQPLPEPMSTVAELMERMISAVFNEPDAGRRSAAIADTFAGDVQFTDVEGTVTGSAALAAKVTALLEGAPGLVFVHAGPLREIPGTLGVRSWRLGPVDGAPVVAGTDVAVVRDGRIATLYTLLDGGPNQA